MEEVIFLEQTGITIDNVVYKASIAQFAGDNLATHQVFGLKQCFRGENICHLCDASSDSMQTNFVTDGFELKTKDS